MGSKEEKPRLAGRTIRRLGKTATLRRQTKGPPGGFPGKQRLVSGRPSPPRRTPSPRASSIPTDTPATEAGPSHATCPAGAPGAQGADRAVAAVPTPPLRTTSPSRPSSPHASSSDDEIQPRPPSPVAAARGGAPPRGSKTSPRPHSAARGSARRHGATRGCPDRSRGRCSDFFRAHPYEGRATGRPRARSRRPGPTQAPSRDRAPGGSADRSASRNCPPPPAGRTRRSSGCHSGRLAQRNGRSNRTGGPCSATARTRIFGSSCFPLRMSPGSPWEGGVFKLRSGASCHPTPTVSPTRIRPARSTATFVAPRAAPHRLLAGAGEP